MKRTQRGVLAALVATAAMLIAGCGSSETPAAGGGTTAAPTSQEPSGSADPDTSSAAPAESTAASTTDATAGSSAPAGPAKDVTLMLNWYPYGEHAPLYLGLKTGIFTDHGINLTIVPGKGSGTVAKAIGQKQATFGWVDTPAVLSAVQAGVPIKSVGVFYQTTPSAVQFFKDQNITKPSDLKGKKIAITPGDPFTVAFGAFLTANGMTTDDVQLVNVDPSAKISSVISGQADALLGFIDDQGPTIAQKTGREMSYLRFADFGVLYLGTGLVAPTDTISDDPELVRAMVAAVSESFTAAVKDPDAAIASMAGVSPNLPEESVLAEQWKLGQTSLSTPNTTSLPPGANSEKDWESTIKVFTDQKQLKPGGTPDQFWDSSFAPKA
ncbi:ABC transporter substrate-binding protein [Nakamurella lactea]|uniref:ABC transporter substrate-binding protein n=1 Tax=Nakamurella lactea TaxID=459515 RepID=UPI0003FE2824|nr:ABC transporter substrate-binding protein [Nakamurella lactea]